MFVNSLCTCGNDASRTLGIEPVCEQCYREAMEDTFNDFPLHNDGFYMRNDDGEIVERPDEEIWGDNSDYDIY